MSDKNPIKKMNKILIRILLGLILCSAFLQGGTSLTDTLSSSVLGQNWYVRIFLPDLFDPDTNTYPAFFLLHGSGGDEQAWDPIIHLLDSLIREKEIAPCIAVAPASGTSWWVDGSNPWETAFIKELIPYVTRKYHLTDHRDGRCVAGFSMGGYGALRYGLRYPELFSSAILLSPAIYNGLPPKESSARSSGAFGNPFQAALWNDRNYPAILQDYLKQENQVFFFISAGDDDWNHPEWFHYNIEQQVVLLYGLLNKKNNNPAELRIVNGGHNWNVWKPLFVEGLKSIRHHSPYFSFNNQYSNPF
jgi:enterochelin esterase-like enzyme